MHFNPDKCFVLRIPSSKSPIITNYTFGNTVCCKKYKTHTYLGVDIQHDLKWNNHINRITSTASKTLGFVRRNLHSCTKDTKAQAYKMLIRPSVEYYSAVWDPLWTHTKIGKIQRRAARLVCNNYDWRQSVTELIQKLEWDMLKIHEGK